MLAVFASFLVRWEPISWEEVTLLGMVTSRETGPDIPEYRILLPTLLLLLVSLRGW